MRSTLCSAIARSIVTIVGILPLFSVAAYAENGTSAPLPATGGTGTVLFTVVGLSLTVAAAALLFLRK